MAYENLLEKLVATPDKVTEEELKSIGEDVDKLKQEAENRITKLPRDQMEVKLALLRGDKVSPKSFKELKDTAIGLSGSLQAYVTEVNQIPVGSIMAIQNQSSPSPSNTIPSVDADTVDMGD